MNCPTAPVDHLRLALQKLERELNDLEQITDTPDA